MITELLTYLEKLFVSYCLQYKVKKMFIRVFVERQKFE